MCRIDFADDGVWLTPPGERTARKEHCCDDCGRTIDPFERSHYGVWKDGEGSGGVFTVKMCAQCVTAGRWLRKVCSGHLWPGVLEELVEHWDEEWDLRSNGLRWLIVCGQARWQRRGRLVSPVLVAQWVDRALTKVPAGALP